MVVFLCCRGGGGTPDHLPAVRAQCAEPGDRGRGAELLQGGEGRLHRRHQVRSEWGGEVGEH